MFLKKKINLTTIILMVVSVLFLAIGFTNAKPTYAEEEPTYVAKVGNVEYVTIDEAIANWTHNTTLTLLADVTLSDVIKLSSTEYHVLDLGTFTMTAASKKDAIQIIANGRSSASYALDIKADATNPGGITATGKTVVLTTGKSGVKDRPIIRFYNGIFNGSYVVKHSGSNGTNCPQFQFHGGEFSGTINTNRTLNQFYGGTFNGSLMMSVDSSAYTLIAGGRFKNLSNLMNSTLNSDKFTIGSSKGNYNREVYIDDDGYYVVSNTLPTSDNGESDIGAVVSGLTYNSNNYFYYSKLNTTGELNFTSVEVAMNNTNSKGKTIVFKETLDKELVLKQNITINLNADGAVLPSNNIVLNSNSVNLTINCEDDSKLDVLNVTTNVNGYLVNKVEDNGVVVYSVVKAVAQIGTKQYVSLNEALAAANNGDIIKLLNAVAEEVVVDKNITIESNGLIDIENVNCEQDKHVISDENNIIISEHTASDWIIDLEPNCTENGSKHIECTVCHVELETKEIPANGHTLEQVDAKASTCTEIGWDAYEKCSVCDYTTYVEIEANSHTLEYVDAKAPTCTEIGWGAYEKCSVCEHTTYVEIPATGHALEYVDAKEPTCKEIGWDVYEKCSVCDHTTYVEKEKLEHVYDGECEAHCSLCFEQRIIDHVDEDADGVCDNCEALLLASCAMAVTNIPFAITVSVVALLIAVALIVVRRRKYNR